jgi:hypothetical protein
MGRPRWSTLTDCVRVGTAVADDEIEDRGQNWTEAFTAAMHRKHPQTFAAVDGSTWFRMAFCRTQWTLSVWESLPSNASVKRQYR